MSSACPLGSSGLNRLLLRALRTHVGHHGSSNHAPEAPWQLYAGDSRPASHGAWPGMQPDSHGSSAAASSALWLGAAETAPPSQGRMYLLEEEQLLNEHLPAAFQSLDGRARSACRR